MPASQQHISPATPMGVNLVGGGATVRVWAPRAREVFLCGDFNDFARDDSARLVRNPDGRVLRRR
jgi:1,4-alpha-glucan branching enzyme